VDGAEVSCVIAQRAVSDLHCPKVKAGAASQCSRITAYGTVGDRQCAAAAVVSPAALASRVTAKSAVKNGQGPAVEDTAAKPSRVAPDRTITDGDGRIILIVDAATGGAGVAIPDREVRNRNGRTLAIWKTRPAVLPSTASTSAPAPLMVTLLSTSNTPLVSVMTPEMPAASIVSPSFASTSAWRSEPGPLSLVLLTMMVAACAAIARALAKVKQIAMALNLRTSQYPRIARALQRFESNTVVTLTNHRSALPVCGKMLDVESTQLTLGQPITGIDHTSLRIAYQ
jgi:hypothetical protein